MKRLNILKAKNDMEKELIINGRYEEPKSYKIYDLVKYNGY